MNDNRNYSKRKQKGLFLIVVMVLVIVALMLYSVLSSSKRQIELSEQKILQEAIAHFDNLVVTRSWNALYGGVYVKPTPGMQPNPYLNNNTLKDAEGNTLIKINPAWMTRQISELSNKQSRYYYKITSLKPINVNNAPDAFEKEALNYFDQHPSEKYYSRLTPDQSRFDFMGALKTVPECLACHVYQGYKVNDIRGGIRVSIPTDLLKAEIQAIKAQTLNNVIFISICAVALLSILFRFISTIFQHQQKVEQINRLLERTVQERTHSIKVMYQHEKYIKDLLKTVANVNELLLVSMSIQHVLKNSVDELTKYPHYRFSWIGMVQNDLLEVMHKSCDHFNIIEQNVYKLDDQSCEPQIAVALEALAGHFRVIRPFQLNLNSGQVRRANDYCLRWVISLPLISKEDEKAIGVFNVFSDREMGFEQEEVNVLEKLATDISMIVNSHKQKAVLEKMESERLSNYEETILAFVNIIEQRDTYTAGHTLRVAEYCKKIALTLNLDQHEIKMLEQAAILHDIGKIATPDAVLLKPGRLTNLEYELIKQHAYAGYSMLSKIDMYKDLAEIILYHHIRYDNKGYPVIDSQSQVPFLSYILALADAFDAMTTNRIYKARKSVADSLMEIEQFSGTQFHPLVVSAAIIALKDVEIPVTSQTPSTISEQKRFAYFFEDVLTGLYNENYLQVILAGAENRYRLMSFISLNNFSHYNKTYGWKQGNEFLIQLAKALKIEFPQALHFRYHGDGFVMLFEQTDILNSEDFIKRIPSLLDPGVSFTMKHVSLENIDSLQQLPI